MLGNIPVIVVPLALGGDPSFTFELEAEWINPTFSAERITMGVQAEYITYDFTAEKVD